MDIFPASIVFPHLLLIFCALSEMIRNSGKVYRVLVGKPGGKRPLGRPRHRWKDGIRMDFREIAGGV
jgi:hypothetical protein